MGFANGEWRTPEGFGVGPVEWEHAPAPPSAQESSPKTSEEGERNAGPAQGARRGWRPLVVRPRRSSRMHD